jgi:hypothetical protein
MVLEWLRRRSATLDSHLRQYLFSDGPILALEARADAPATSPGAGLGIGSLKPREA